MVNLSQLLKLFKVNKSYKNAQVRPICAFLCIYLSLVKYQFRISFVGGKAIARSPRTLSIANNGQLTNNGTFTKGTGTVNFAGSGTISGTVSFNNVTINGGVNFGTASTVDGTLTVNAVDMP